MQPVRSRTCGAEVTRARHTTVILAIIDPHRLKTGTQLRWDHLITTPENCHEELACMRDVG